MPAADLDVEYVPLAKCADDLSPFRSETPTAEDQALNRLTNGFGADLTNQPSFMAFMFVGHKHSSDLGDTAGRTGRLVQTIWIMHKREDDAPARSEHCSTSPLR